MHERSRLASRERGPEGRGNPALAGGSLRWARWSSVTEDQQQDAKGAKATGGRGRKRLREALARPGQINVRVSEQERAALSEKATRAGVTIPRLLVEAALEGDGAQIRQERLGLARALNETRARLATVANNVNQLARVANTTGELGQAEQLAQTRAEVAELVAELRTASRTLTFPTSVPEDSEPAEA